MKAEFHITGMTCDGCRTDVEDRLNRVDGVQQAQVSLERESVSVYSNKEIPIQRLMDVLPTKYSLSSKTPGRTLHETDKKVSNNKIKQLKPLFIIIGYITVASILLNYYRESWSGFMLDFMGLFFIVFSFFKFLDLKGFTRSFSMYDPLAKNMNLYAWMYAFIETALGLLFLTRIEITTAAIITLIVLSITTIGITKTLIKKDNIQCACLGTALKLPMTEATLIENSIMIVMALGMLITQ